MSTDRDTVKRQARQVFWKSLRAPFVMFWVIRVRKLIIWDEHTTPFVPMDAAGQLGPALQIRRGRLPPEYADYETPDEALPGGLYEQRVLDKLLNDGPEACAFYWLGLRNRAHGYAMRFAKPAAHHWTSAEGRQEQGEGENAIWIERKLYFGGRFERLRGYRVYSRDNGVTFYATPVWTYKRA